MKENEAYAILHPDTTRDKLAEIEYYAGFKGEEAKIKAVEEACIVACNAMLELALYQAIGTVEEFKALKDKAEPTKPLGGVDIDGNEYRICRECSAIVEDGEWRADYCPDCGCRIDWTN